MNLIFMGRHMLNQLQQDLRKEADPAKKKVLQKFFKTGPGEYGEGDVFLGLTVPKIRKVVQQYKQLALSDIETLLNSEIHEERLCALLILVHKYQKGTPEEKEAVYDFYLKNAKKVNNWDLVDSSAEKIMGPHLLNKDKDILYKLVKSDNLWERRIAIMTTFHFIKNNKFEDTLKLSEMLITDPHDLIHKAVGWMLREVGKRDQELEETFLKKHYKAMPRTMLRYAIEKFDEKKRKFYMQK